MALCTSCGVLLLLATLNVALAVPAGSSYSVEEHIPAGSRFGITAPLGSSGERVVVQAKDDEGDAAGNPTKPEKSAAETNSSTTATPSDNSVTTSAAPAPAAPVPSIVAASVTSTSSSTSAVTSRQAAEPRRAKVVLVGSAPGELILDQSAPGEPVTITGAISGLTPGKHGFHIHVYGDTGDSCAAAGGHFNPAQAKHGAPSASVRHVGDLGNIVADDQGIAAVDIQDPLASLYDGVNNVVGRGVVVHAKEDDLGLGGDDGSMATGNAGGRVSCGVIGLAGPAKKKN